MSDIPPPNYTQVPNIIFDYWMEKLSPAEFKILLCLCRKTFGWNKRFDDVSLRQITEMTGLTRKGVTLALPKLIEHGLVVKVANYTKKQNFVANRYEVRVIDPTKGVVNSVHHPSELSTPGVVNSVPTQKKDLQKKDKQKSMSAADASDVNNSLFRFLKKKNEKFQIKSKKAWEKNTIKLLKQYEKAEVLKVIEWVFTADHKKAEFWQDVIKSPDSLYKNIDQIVIQMNHKTTAEKEKDAAKEKAARIEDNRRWLSDMLGRVKFDDYYNRRIGQTETCAEIKNGSEYLPIGYGEVRFKQIIEHKLRSWGLL